MLNAPILACPQRGCSPAMSRLTYLSSRVMSRPFWKPSLANHWKRQRRKKIDVHFRCVFSRMYTHMGQFSLECHVASKC